jgi:hypothetical protein
MIYYEHGRTRSKGPFSVLEGYSHAGFSMPLGGSVARFICENRAFSGCIARLAIARSEQSSLRRLVSACSNMAFILYGTVWYGSN